MIWIWFKSYCWKVETEGVVIKRTADNQRSVQKILEQINNNTIVQNELVLEKSSSII